MKSCMYKLYELKSQIESSIANLTNVMAQQTGLAHIVDSYKDEEGLVSLFNADARAVFVKGIKEQVDEYNTQLETLKEHLANVDRLIEYFETTETREITNDIITTLMTTLGICEAEEIGE